MFFFDKKRPVASLQLNGKDIKWVEKWPYLGVMLNGNKQFDCSIQDRLKKFYRCANAIFRIDGHSDELVMLQLAESHCIPLLTYAIEIIHVANRDERRQLRVAYNSVFRKIFGYRWSQSVTALQGFLGKPTWEQLVDTRKSRFSHRTRENPSNLLPNCFFT